MCREGAWTVTKQRKRNARTGKVLGIPYDFRTPTKARFRERWWNKEQRQVMVPKVYGWGYDLNLYELGRRLRILGRK